MENRFETFSGSIVQLNRCLQKIKDLEMRRLGLRANHAMCLYYLGRHPEGLTATQLTDLCREDKAAISRTLAQLAEKDLVCCPASDGKRSYRAPYHLTSQGQALVQKINDRAEYALSTGGQGLTDAQRTAFYEAMGVILGNLEEYLEQNREPAEDDC